MRFVAAGVCALAVLAARLDGQAAHFDSLAIAELAKPHPDQERFQRLATIAYALANGAVPGQVAMSVAGRTISFQIIGLRHTSLRAVGWHDAAADTMISILAPVADEPFSTGVALWRDTTVDSAAVEPRAFQVRAVVSDTPCGTFYRLIHALYAESQICDVGHASMAFATISASGTVIGSPPVTFGVVRIVPPPTVRPVEP